MWTHVEVLVWSLGWRSCVRYPGTHVHVGDANPVDVSRSACQAILDPLQEDSIKAPRLVMRFLRNEGRPGPQRVGQLFGIRLGGCGCRGGQVVSINNTISFTIETSMGARSTRASGPRRR